MRVANGDGGLSDGGFDLRRKGWQPTTLAHNDNARPAAAADNIRHVNDIPLLLRLPERYSTYQACNKPLHFLSHHRHRRRRRRPAMRWCNQAADYSVRKYRNFRATLERARARLRAWRINERARLLRVILACFETEIASCESARRNISDEC